MSSPQNQVSGPGVNTPYHTIEDTSSLQSINESTVFLHDGVLRSISLKALKDFESHAKFQDALTISSINQLEDLIGIRSNNVDDLSKKIIKLATLHVQGIGLHHRYQWNVVERIWRYKHSRATETAEKEASAAQASLQQTDSENESATSGTNDVGAGGLGFKLSLCLLIPMLEAYATQNRDVALSAMKLIFEELASFPVMSLAQENSHSLEKLEDLLGNWSSSTDSSMKESGPSAMIALACARGVISALLKTVLMLETVEKHQKFPVGHILRKLDDVRVKIGKPCGILHDKHVTTWQYDDRLLADSIQFEKTLGTKSHTLLEFSQNEEMTSGSASATQDNSEGGGTQAGNNRQANTENRPTRLNASAATAATTPTLDEIHRYFVATDGSFLFVTGPDSKGLSKVGTGLRGTLQGWVYHNNVELNCGFLAYTNGTLISRPFELDTYGKRIDEKLIFGITINTATLKPEKLILLEPIEEFGGNWTTLGMTSDGSSVYLIRAEYPKDNGASSPQAPSESTSSSGGTPGSPPTPPVVNVWLDILKIVDTAGRSTATVIPKQLKIPLIRQEEMVESDKSCLGEGRLTRRTRSVRITSSPPVPPPLPGSNQPNSQLESMNTTLNVTLKQLQTGLYISCGNYLTIIFSNNAQLLLPTSIGPTSGVAAVFRQYAPVISPSCPKSIGTQIHFCLNNTSPQCTKHDLLSLVPESSFYHGAIIPEVGATYDHVNNLIWTVNGSFADCWKNTGHIPIWKQTEMFHDPLLPGERAPTLSPTGSAEVDARTVTNAILRHCGIMANHYVSGDKSDANIGFNSTVLKTLIELLFKYRSNFEGPELTSIFLVLQAIVSQITNLDPGSEVYEDLSNVQVMILCILNDTTSINRFSSSVAVYQEACKLFAMSFDLLYTSTNSRNEFFNELHVYLGRSEDSSSSTRGCLLMLQDTVLQHFSNSLDNPLTKYEDGCKWILDMQWFTKVIQRSNDEIRQTFMKIGERGFALKDVILLTSNLPNASVSTRYIASVVNFYLRCTLLQKSDIAISIFREVLKSGPMIVEACIEAISMRDRMNLAMYNVSEAILKSSILANGIPQILGFLSHDLQSIRKLFDELSEECVQLTVALSFLAKKMNPTQKSNLGDDWSSNVKILSPWNTKRVFESPHPIRDSHKVKETIIIPECRQLQVKFHPQSASQYDYDRLIFYSGSGVKNKICEFGGNYYGFGNRYFSGPGWARSLMRIDGNGMTYMFEMKSGREHSVPDKALWGYQFSVYPIFDHSDVQKPLRSEDDEESLAPVTTGFTTLTALHCIDVVQNMTGALLQGNPLTVEEKHNCMLLENKLVCGLNWPESPVKKDLLIPRKFSAELIQKVKRCVGVPPLQMRTSITEKIRAPELEELYLQCCFQHIGTNPYLNTDLLVSGNESSWDTEPTRDILRDIFRNIDTLFRKIMAFYEMEKMLCQEIEEISNHTKDITEAFFTDANFMESSSDLQTLAWICYLEYSPDNPMNLVNDVIAMVTALSADGSVPQLTRTDELIEETHAKCKYLLQASQNIEMQIIGPAFPSSKTVLERLHNIHGFLSVHLYSPKCTINSFIEARRVRRERALDRIKGLDMLHKVLECSNPSSALLIVTATLLQRGPRLETILCSGEERDVIKIFGKVMKAAVTIADKNPLLHRFTIALLSVTKYDRTDEENLVESGLVGLLDQLCAYQTGQHPNKPEVSTEGVAVAHNKASTLAWAAFQVLAAQCASWERVSNDLKNVWGDYIDSEWDEPEHRELPLQISINVTNHLARAAALAALSSSTPNQSWESSGPSCSPSLSVAIQDVLDLLSNLRTYKIGRAILKQGPCICRLLALLQDSRLSPRLVLTILKLLHTALPLVDDLDTQNCKQIVPRTSRSHGSGNVNTSINSFLTIIDSTPYTQVASMLLTKLADYLVCGPQQQHKLSENTSTNRHNCQSSRSQGVMIGLTDPKYERMEVWVHKTTDQSSSSLLRQLFVDTTRLDLKPTRGTLNDLDNELNSNGKVLLYTEESSWAERKALRISQLGHLVTLTPIGFSRPGYKSTGIGALNRGQADLLCKDRNLHLSSWDPARPFLSGNVAENLASEIVQLVRALLFTKRDKEGSQSTSGKSSGSSSQGHVPSSTSITSSSPETCSLGQESIVSDAAAQLTKRSAWCGAVEQVICGALKLLPRLSQMPMNPTSSQLESYVYSARIVIAALTVLGGFTETIRPGLEVWIVDKKDDGNLVEGSFEQNEMEFNAEWEYKATKGKVISVSETCPTCKVEIISTRSSKDKTSGDLAVSDILTVPLCRVCPAHFKKTGIPHLPNLSRFTQIEIAGYLKTLLLTGSGATPSGSSKGHGAGQECPLKRSLPTLNQIVSSANNSSSPFSSINQISESRQIAQAMTICRLLAEIRTKAMQVLSLWLKKKEFCNIFLGIGSESQFQKKFTNDVLEAMDNLKGLGQECIPSHKQVSLDSQVAWMRLLYRDCTKPPRLPITTEKSSDEMRWDVQRAFPKIRSAVFSSISNTIVYTGDYNVTPGNPRGLVVFGSAVIPSTNYYWEATIVSMDDSGQHSDLIVVPPMSVGFSPLPSSTSGTGDVWKYPSGSVLYTTLGRVVHYKNQDPGSWVTLRLDDENFRIKSGDTIGIGWEKGENSGGGGANTSGNAPTLPQRLRMFRTAIRNPSVSIVTPDTVANGRRQRAARSTNQVNLEVTISNVPNTNPPAGVRGVVFFTLNGRRLPPSVEQSNCNLHPILHIQKRQMVVHTNLGEKPFLYTDANKPNSNKQPPNSGTAGGPSSESRRNGTAETGTGNADVLLRRVSDSLQDLNLVFNLNVADFDSEQEFNINRSGSSSTVSEASNNSTNREEDWHNIPPDEDDDGDNADADDDDEEFTEAVFSESSIVRMPNATARALRGNRSRQVQPPLPILPPTPVSGVSVSGSSIAVNRPTSSRRARHVATPRPPSARKEENSVAPQKGVLSFTSLLQSGSVGGYYGGHSHTKNELVAKPRAKMTDYNPTKSLEYFMPHSPTIGIRVFHGPRRYVCSCASHCPTPLDFLLLEKPKDTTEKTQADMDSIDGYEDDDDDDIHSLLVKAWEAQVFPVIRRRFRNESERRDGLEQIRGALQLGMLDIARQTVEFLYEEGGGVPRDMHFPTLEEVRTEATRCTVDKVKPGMSVNIRSLQDLTDGSSVLPNYGVGSMLSTFGLVGEVLEVDLVHDLVLVETYIEPEGVLVRFWYPVSCLDKSQSNKKPTLSTNTVNMFKLHSNLISMESSACHLYTRQCYLSVCQYCHKNVVSNEESSIVENDTLKICPLAAQIFYDFDLDSIQILSDHFLASYPPTRDLFTYNLQCDSPSMKFLSDPGNPSVIFYKDPEYLSKCIRSKIREACKNGEDSINELTGRLVHILGCPDRFPYHDVQLDRISDFEVSLPGVAFSLVTFKGPQLNKHMTNIDNTAHPCVHISSYDSSEVCRYLMACYPLEPLHVVMHRSSGQSEDGAPIISHTAPTTTPANLAVNKTLRKRHIRFPPTMCPTDRIHLSISEMILPDVIAEIQGIPKEFPLCLLYIQVLVSEIHRDSTNFTFGNVTTAVTSLIDFLDQIHLSPVIKDWIFTLIAELTRVKKDDMVWRPSPSEKVSRSCTPNRLFFELLLLRDKEVEPTVPFYMSPIITAIGDNLESSLKGKHSKFAPASLMDHISAFISCHQRFNKASTDPNFSFYFNSLNDLCLALNEVSEIMVNPYEIIPCSASTSKEPSPISSPQRRPSSSTGGTSDSLISLQNAVSTVVHLPNKRAIPKIIRKRGKDSKNKDVGKSHKNGQSGSSSSSSSDKAGQKQVEGTASEDGLLAFAKASEIEWFNNQVVITRVLRDIVWHTPNDPNCSEAAQVLIATILERLKTPTMHSRLLVISGAPVDIDGMSIEASLIRALRGCGGIHGNEMWISGTSVVVEIRSLSKVNEAYDLLKQNKVWYPLEDYVLYPNVNVYRVTDSLKVQDPQGDYILDKFLKSKLSDPEMPDKLSFRASETLTNIFMSCYSVTIPFVPEDSSDSGNEIVLGEEQITLKICGNLLQPFIIAVAGDNYDIGDAFKTALSQFGENIVRKVEDAPKLSTHYDTDDVEVKTEGVLEVTEGIGKTECGQSSSHNVADDVGQLSVLKPPRDIRQQEEPDPPIELKGLSLRGFLDWCSELLRTQTNLLWKGLFSAGFDLKLERTWVAEDPPLIYNYFHSENWSLEKDVALIRYIDAFSQHLHIDPIRIQPPEVYLMECDFVNPSFACLQGVELPNIRIRWAMLQKMNSLLSKKLVAHVSVHAMNSTHRSLARLLHDSRQLLMYYTKDAFLYKVINISASRGSDTPTPEIMLDPVSSIGRQDDTTFKTQLCHIIQQMSTITTSFYTVPPAQGADPALPISVKFQGEEVLGLSGSYRHFLLNATKELHSETVKLLCRCPSADAGKNKDSFIITPGNLSYGEEDFLHFLGQLIGISIRSDAPLALSLLKATWRSLLYAEKELGDSSDNLIEADILCATYLKKLESLSTKMAFDNFLSLNAWPKFHYPSMDNTSVVPLCQDGSRISLSFANREQFIKQIKEFREKELESRNKVTKILTGLATIVPLPAILGLFTSDHLELRIAGSPEINLSLLKSHTHYQVGVSENDPHIMYFWAALESFTPEELKKFIKFSANLERLPVTCPCQSQDHSQESSNANIVHAPPFPMKIAPIDLPSGMSIEEIDKRLIRVETCLFLIRLPPYSSLQVTRQQLTFAINCREDPLSG